MSGAGGVSSDGGTWRFAIVTDTHVGQPEGKGVHNPSGGPYLAGRFAAFGPALADCDFCLHLGDVVDHGTRDEIAEAAATMRRWPCPVRICLGNHDARAEGDRAAWRELYPEGFPHAGDELQFSFTHRGVHVAVLQTDWRDADGVARPWWASGGCHWQLSAAQLAWLDADLAAHAGEPTLVAHHPLSVPLTARLTGTTDLHLPDPEPAAALQAVLARHPQVRVLAGGHAHAHQAERVGPVLHLATGCVSEYPVEYRRVEVAPTTWTITTHPWPAPDPGQQPADQARNPWVAGQPADRTVTVASG